MHFGCKINHALTHAGAPIALDPGGVRRAGGAGGVNRRGTRRSLRILFRQVQDATDGKAESAWCSHHVHSGTIRGFVFALKGAEPSR